MLAYYLLSSNFFRKFLYLKNVCNGLFQNKNQFINAMVILFDGFRAAVTVGFKFTKIVHKYHLSVLYFSFRFQNNVSYS